MRLHSDIITLADITRATIGLPGVYATASEHGSRLRERGIELALGGNGYRTNTGKTGASDETGATWDEWGVVIARLFAIDPDALWGSAKHPIYRDAADFHQITDYRFESGELPRDTHKRHAWKWDTGHSAHCTHCTAAQMPATAA